MLCSVDNGCGTLCVMESDSGSRLQCNVTCVSSCTLYIQRQICEQQCFLSVVVLHYFDAIMLLSSWRCPFDVQEAVSGNNECS